MCRVWRLCRSLQCVAIGNLYSVDDIHDANAIFAIAVYGIAAPVIPFRLEHLGYSDVESLTGWLVAGKAVFQKLSVPSTC